MNEDLIQEINDLREILRLRDEQLAFIQKMSAQLLRELSEVKDQMQRLMFSTMVEPLDEPISDIQLS